jgi:hypothetical protein
MSGKETYLGDGLYASFDGWQFCLRAPRENGDHFVYMEASVLRAFQAFVKRATESEDET